MTFPEQSVTLWISKLKGGDEQARLVARPHFGEISSVNNANVLNPEKISVDSLGEDKLYVVEAEASRQGRRAARTENG